MNNPRTERNEDRRWVCETTYDGQGNFTQKWTDKRRQPQQQANPIRNPGVQYPQDDADDFGMRRNG